MPLLVLTRRSAKKKLPAILPWGGDQVPQFFARAASRLRAGAQCVVLFQTNTQQKGGNRMFRKAAVVAGLSIAFAGGAQAKGFEALLQGDYAFSGEAGCLVSPGGFDNDGTPVNDPSTPFPFVTSFSVQGVRTFNGDGTGSVKARVVNMSHPYALPATQQRPFNIFNRGGVSSLDIWSEFTYTVTPDLRVVITTPRIDAQVRTGPRAGQSMWFKVPEFQGYLSQDHRTLTVAHEEPEFEEHHFQDGSMDKRMCHRSRILFELKPGK